MLTSVIAMGKTRTIDSRISNILSNITLGEISIVKGDPTPMEGEEFQSLVAVIFLNRDWRYSDGGELQLHPLEPYTFAKISPVFDRVVIYPNNQLSPVILPAKRISLSFTMVFK